MRRSFHTTYGLQLALLALPAVITCAQTIHGREGITLPAPPAVEANPVTDDYAGAKVVDSYRWLEDAASPETRAAGGR
jgi:prolyl oligopeptidase